MTSVTDPTQLNTKQKKQQNRRTLFAHLLFFAVPFKVSGDLVILLLKNDLTNSGDNAALVDS